ncbi:MULTISPECIES: 2'-5' RNA ligase family protein [Bradyrhizobium]|jgi:2'-5' RNA ligase|uniref:2'-5' RNA ligase n=2 Tax=Bradyrhizobium TaxID=374 RepID=A0ABY0P657_9BRAD|nr:MULTISPECIES: 2'-5' RNA ligase family protein [Bradyrhizobium]SDH46901.1 2'-5' RNA ligase [Bradyrhizobium ottawaense]SEE30087.1 2'-5' RNA ligase [Bradyrhizobium lablabi]SHM26414.1 2'-5' RNA ligase [Bradyrhizobium lablabi]
MSGIANFDSARLFLAAIPDTGTAARIHRLAGVLKRAHQFNGKLIEPERLHVSLFFLGGLPEPDIRAACAAAAEVRMEPFEVLFDRTASFRGKGDSRPFVLVGDNGLQRLISFRRMLGDVMMRKGLRKVANTNFAPHVTLLYDARAVEEYPVEPICWTVNEFVLIRSLRGHDCLARWSLDARSVA